MRHLKTFEAYSLNEEENIRKFFTGHESGGDKKRKIEEFMAKLDDYDAKISENPQDYSYNRTKLEKDAKDNNYKGEIIEITSRATGKIGVIYKRGRSGFSDLSSGAGGSIRSNR